MNRLLDARHIAPFRAIVLELAQRQPRIEDELVAIRAPHGLVRLERQGEGRARRGIGAQDVREDVCVLCGTSAQ